MKSRRTTFCYVVIVMLPMHASAVPFIIPLPWPHGSVKARIKWDKIILVEVVGHLQARIVYWPRVTTFEVPRL